jgi:hypothetical protein
VTTRSILQTAMMVAAAASVEPRSFRSQSASITAEDRDGTEAFQMDLAYQLRLH